MFDLKAKPFYLSDEDIAWVKDTLAGMTEDEKIGQLFFPCMRTYDEKGIDELLKYHPSGVMYRPAPASEEVFATNYMKKKCKIPMLIAANLEKGGNGIANEGTLIGSPMGLAACDDVEMATKLGTLCAREGKAVGANWAFAPIIDIDYNFRNPITNLRTFGSCPERVAAYGELQEVHAAQAHDGKPRHQRGAPRPVGEQPYEQREQHGRQHVEHSQQGLVQIAEEQRRLLARGERRIYEGEPAVGRAGEYCRRCGKGAPVPGGVDDILSMHFVFPFGVFPPRAASP